LKWSIFTDFQELSDHSKPEFQSLLQNHEK